MGHKTYPLNFIIYSERALHSGHFCDIQLGPYRSENVYCSKKETHIWFALELNCCLKIQLKIKFIIFHFATDSGQSS